ncbi:MAG: CPBP family intramembrane glutamic endopeptidase [Egibacteraceae bacterium]
MSGLVVLGFPLILGAGFLLAFLVHRALFGHSSTPRFEKSGHYLYLGLLLIPLALVVLDRRAEGGIAALFEPHASHPAWWGPVWLAVGVLLGSALFAAELWGTVLLRALPRVRRATAHLVVEGRTASLTGGVEHPLRFLTLTVVIVLIEEIIWRGHLTEFLVTQWGVPWPASLAVSGVAFGLNHAYFGLRNVAFKALSGVAWGVLLTVSGLLWAAIVSHLTFDLWVWGRLLKGRGHERLGDAGSLDRVRTAL